MNRGSIVALGSDETLYIVAHIENGFIFIHKLRGSKKILKLPFDSVKLLILWFSLCPLNWGLFFAYRLLVYLITHKPYLNVF